MPPEDYTKVEFEDRTTGTNVPKPYIPAIEKVRSLKCMCFGYKQRYSEKLQLKLALLYCENVHYGKQLFTLEKELFDPMFILK